MIWRKVSRESIRSECGRYSINRFSLAKPAFFEAIGPALDPQAAFLGRFTDPAEAKSACELDAIKRDGHGQITAMKEMAR